MLSLKKLLSLTVAVTTTLLVIVLLVAFFQRRITSSYGEVLEQGGAIVFRFNSLRDHLIEAMLEEKWDSFGKAGEELEAINRDLLKLLDHPYVPAGFKVSLADRVDIQGIALLVRKIGSDPEKKALSVQLAASLRIMADQLFRLDRVLVGQMNERLIQFQKMAIGALTLITGMTGLLLVVLYRRGFRPLLILINRLEKGTDANHISSPAGACREFGVLVRLIRGQAGTARDNGPRSALFPAARTINQISNLLNGIINYAQLLLDECQLRGGTDEQKTMLRKIVAHSEEISRLVRGKENERLADNPQEPSELPAMPVND